MAKLIFVKKKTLHIAILAKETNYHFFGPKHEIQTNSLIAKFFDRNGNMSIKTNTFPGFIIVHCLHYELIIVKRRHDIKHTFLDIHCCPDNQSKTFNINYCFSF